MQTSRGQTVSGLAHAASSMVRRARLVASAAMVLAGFAGAAKAGIDFVGERKLNNLVAELLLVSSVSQPSQAFDFIRANDGWIFISASCHGRGTLRVLLDPQTRAELALVQDGPGTSEAV